jgi:hypothetical protein
VCHVTERCARGRKFYRCAMESVLSDRIATAVAVTIRLRGLPVPVIENVCTRATQPREANYLAAAFSLGSTHLHGDASAMYGQRLGRPPRSGLCATPWLLRTCLTARQRRGSWQPRAGPIRDQGATRSDL